MSHLSRVAWAVVTASAIASAAHGADVKTISAPGITNMRLGPGMDYPVVAKVRGGEIVTIQGCLARLTWCEVAVHGKGGWMVGWRLRIRHMGRWMIFTDFPDSYKVTIIDESTVASRIATEAGPMPDGPPRKPGPGKVGSGTVSPSPPDDTIVPPEPQTVPKAHGG